MPTWVVWCWSFRWEKTKNQLLQVFRDVRVFAVRLLRVRVRVRVTSRKGLIIPLQTWVDESCININKQNNRATATWSKEKIDFIPNKIFQSLDDLTSSTSFSNKPRKATARVVVVTIHARRTISTCVVNTVINVWRKREELHRRSEKKVFRKSQKGHWTWKDTFSEESLNHYSQIFSKELFQPRFDAINTNPSHIDLR